MKKTATLPKKHYYQTAKNYQQIKKMRFAYRLAATFCLVFGLFTWQNAGATTFTSNVATGSWNTAATWSVSNTTNSNTVPGSGDIVIIQDGHIITLGGDIGSQLSPCTSLTIENNNNGTESTLVLNGHTLNVGNVTFNPGSSGKKVKLDFGTGTLKVSGAITFPSSNQTNLMLTYSPTSTIEFNGTSAQTLNISAGFAYPNVQISNTAGVTPDEHITTTSITGNLKISGGKLLNGGKNITGISGKLFTIENGGTFVASGTTSFPSGFTPVLNSGSTVEYAGTNQTIAVLPYSNLKISGNGTKTLNSSITLDQAMNIGNGSTLNLSGTNTSITLGNYDLTIQATGSLLGYSSTKYIKQTGTGKLIRQVQTNNTDVEFPVGTNTQYLPVKIKLASSGGTVTDNYSVRVINEVYNNYTNNVPNGDKFINNAVNNTWIIDEAVAGGSNVTLTFSWDNSNSLTNFDLTKTRITHFYNGGWDDDTPTPATLSSGYYSVSRSGIQTFSPFGIFSGTPTPLPVELISFKATRQNKGAILQWITASEKNNAGFQIQTSDNGRNFEDIAFVASHNSNSASVQQYEFQDNTAIPAALRYYRLKQTDLNGTVSFSGIKVVDFRDMAKNLQVYPNPFTQELTLSIESGSSQELQYQVLDLTGKTVLQSTQKLLKGNNTLHINLDKTHPAGIYLLRTQSAEGTTSNRLIKQ